MKIVSVTKTKCVTCGTEIISSSTNGLKMIRSGRRKYCGDERAQTGCAWRRKLDRQAERRRRIFEQNPELSRQVNRERRKRHTEKVADIRKALVHWQDSYYFRVLEKQYGFQNAMYGWNFTRFVDPSLPGYSKMFKKYCDIFYYTLNPRES